MAIPTPSVSRRLRLGAVLVVLLSAACRAPAPPSLERLGRLPAGARAQAKAYLHVALVGAGHERRRAALLWGLAASEAGSPCSALTAFRIASPPGGRARLAARRLAAALAKNGRPELWCRAAAGTWVNPEEREAFLAGAAALASSTWPPCLPGVEALTGEPRAQALAALARTGGAGGTAARQALAVEFPARFERLLAGEDVATASSSLTASELVVQATAWLASDEPARALAAARRAGPPGAAIAAEACLRLRRPSEALAWASRLGDRDVEAWLLRAEAQRRIAWAGTTSRRRGLFVTLLEMAERAHRLSLGSEGRGQAGVLVAEALVELGRYTEAAAWLDKAEVVREPRAEWVIRRRMLLDRRPGELPASAVVSTRVRRLAAFWRATRRSDKTALAELAGSGLPDLPAIWAAQAAGAPRVGLALRTGGEIETPPAPRWVSELLAFGRTADALLAWRADLEEEGVTGPPWLAFLAAAQLPPLDAIPLLVKAERRLLSGPWQGLDRSLLERYLPLPWREELERAAQRSGVPPWVLAGLVRQESAWNPRAVSGAGAVGLTQLVPGTAREVRRRVPEWNGNDAILFDPGINLTLGGLLLARWRGDFAGSWPAALATYNAGERRVREVWERTGRRGGAEFVESLEIPETWDYVHRVVVLAEGYRLLYWPEGRAFPWT